MDNIKNLISQSNTLSENSDKYLLEAYKLLNGLISKRNINESIESATEICVILAESCNKNNKKNEANDCVKLFFSLDPPENQYLARAYIVQAQLIQPNRFDDINTLEKPIGFILKAINFSKKEKQFHYLVYNSSLIYYEIARNFIRPSNSSYLCTSLSQVCKALDETNDSNMEWRSQLMLLLLQCHIDAGHRKEIIQSVDGTATFIGKYAPHLLKDLLALLINNNIGTNEKYLWYTKNSPPMQIFIRICRLKVVKEKDLENSYASEARRILLSLIGVEDPSGPQQSEEVPSSKPDSKRRASVMFSSKKLTNEQRCSLLLELSKVCMQRSIFDVCRQSVDKVKQMCSEEMTDILQEAEFINSELTIMELEVTSEKMTTNSLKVRLSTMEKCRSTLLNAVRTGNHRLIEFGCVTLWNLCLPLLQPSLRDKISSNLILIANSLENIGCLNYRLSCQVHIEVGKYFAASEQANDAIKYFKKAQLLDKTGEYTELLDHFINKLKMQEKLYEKPTEPCDLARQLIEQVHSTLKITKIPLPQLRPLLAQIGHCLAPDDFLVLLDHDLSIEEGGSDNPIQMKATKTSAWESMVTRLSSYLKRSGNINDRIKMTLWGDLVKLARTTQLWDICRVASCFAVLYDDGRWKNHFQLKIESVSTKSNRRVSVNQNAISDTNSSGMEITKSDFDGPDSANGDSKNPKKEETDASAFPLPIKANRLDKFLLELISEIYIIRAEAFMQAIRNEGAQLFTDPVRPRDFKKHPKGYVKDTSKEDGEWTDYCGCLHRMSELIVASFLRSASLATELQAPWMLQNAAIYLWNYSIHIISLSEHGILVPSFQAMFDFMRPMINEKMVHIVTQYGIILSHGSIQKMIPIIPVILDNVFDTPSVSNSADKKAKKGKESPKLKNTTSNLVQTQAESVAQCKKALDICQYLMDITADVVIPPVAETNAPVPAGSAAASKTQPIGKSIDIQTKCRLIEMWVQCKQMLQQPIGPNLGTDDPENKIGQRANVRSIAGVQMLWISQNELYRFTDAPSVEEGLQLIEAADWDRSEVVLQLLVKLCYVAMNSGGANVINLVNKVADAAQKYFVLKSQDGGNLSMSFITFCQGICLHKNSTQHTSILMQCLKLLVKACCYAKDAKNYYLVSQISHYFWTIAQTLIQRSSSSTSIAKEIDTILNCIVSTVDKRRLKLFFEPHTEEELPRIAFELEEKLPHNIQSPDDQKLITIEHCKSLFQSCFRRNISKSSLELDLILRIQMYVAVFQSYFSQEKWPEALKVLDNAIADLPRTNHRLELFRHRVLIKVRMDLSIELDIQKFKNQQEHEISLLWREVAIWSKSPPSQLNAYQKSVESLKLRENDWLKSELVKEMCQWMLHYNYPIDVCDQFIEWAIDILLNIEVQKEKLPEHGSATKKKSSSVGSKKNKMAINIQIDEVNGDDKVTDQDLNIQVTDDNNTVHGVRLHPCCPKAIADIADIYQLSALLINFVFRAKLLGSSDAGFKECIVLANACILRMWTVSMKNVGSIVKEISKIKSETESPSKGKDKKEKKEKEKNPKMETETNKSKVTKRKGPIDWIPSSYEDWATFEVSDDVLDALKSTSHMSSNGLNRNSIKNLGEFVASCETLVEFLEDEGLELLSFPVYSLLDALSRSGETVAAKVLNQYVHLRSLKIALHLNMSSAAAHHERFVETPIALPDSGSFTAIMEMTVKEFKLSQIHQETSTKFPLDFDLSPKTCLTIPHLPRKLSAYGYLHETWTKMGGLFIHLGYNKEASELLHEAAKIAEILEDDKILIEISLLKTQRYVNEGEAESALLTLDTLEERFSLFTVSQWKKMTTLLLEISGHVSYRSEEIKLIKTRLVRLKDHTVKRLAAMNFDNQRSAVDVMLTDINFGIVLLDNRLLDLELNDHKNDVSSTTNQTENVRSLLFLIGQLDHVALRYQALAHIAGLSRVLWTKINIYGSVIKLLDTEHGKVVLLKKLKTVEELLWIQTAKYNDCHATCSESQGHSYSLTVDRQMAKVKLMLVDCLMSIYSMNVDKKVKLTLEHRRQNELKQVVDEYVAESVPDDESPNWREVLYGISDRIMSCLSECHTICHNIPNINARILSRYGHVLKLRAMEINPIDDEQWQQSSKVDSSKPIPEEADLIKTNSDDEEHEPKELTPLEYRQKLLGVQANSDLLQSQEYLGQASEILMQALNLSLNCQNYHAAMYSAEQLMDLLGQYEAATSTQLLCLYQSCMASITMRQRLSATLRQASMGQLAALVLQHNYMINSSECNESNLTTSSLFRSVLDKLNSSFSAWKVTNVTINQSDLLKDLSGVCNGICLIQHSSDSNYVYAAFIDGKQKSVAASKQANKQATAEKGAIHRLKTSAHFTKSLARLWSSFKANVDDTVYDIENRREINLRKTDLYKKIDSRNEMARSLEERERLEIEIDNQILGMENRFSDLSTQLCVYLSPLLEPMCHLLPSHASRSSSSHHKSGPQSISSTKESLIVLLDDILACTAIESLKYFKCPLSRDFSLQILHHRLKVGEKSEADANEGAQTSDANKKKDKSKIPHRIPALRDVNKKSTKILALNRQMPAGALPLDTHQVRYIVDPSSDTNTTKEQSLSAAFRKELTQTSVREQQVTPRWIGLMGDEGYPSVEEVELYVKDASTIVYVNTENIVSLMTPQRIALLNTTDLQLFCCIDRIKNRKIKDRTIQKVRTKNYIDLENEEPVRVAQLLTLAGSKAVLGNQYSALLDWSLTEMGRLFNHFLDSGLSLCESVYATRFVDSNQSPNTNEDVPTNQSQDPNSDIRIVMYSPVVYGLPNFVLNGS